MYSKWAILAGLGILVGCGRAEPSLPGGSDLAAENANTPENAYRQFMLADLAGEEQTIRPLIVDHENADVLWQGAYPKDVAALLAEQYRQMEITRATQPGQEERPDRVLLQSSASPIPLTVVKVGDIWKVDAGPITGFRKAAQKTR